MGQEERGISHHNVPVPGHIRSKKAKKKDQLPSSLLSPISALHWPEATKTSQPRESGNALRRDQPWGTEEGGEQ